jgi:hypothetical protein
MTCANFALTKELAAQKVTLVSLQLLIMPILMLNAWKMPVTTLLMELMAALQKIHFAPLTTNVCK